MAGRRAEVGALLHAGAARRSVADDGSLVVVFRGDAQLREAVRDLVRREKECCPFFDFELVERGDELTVLARAPDEARGMLEGLFSP